MQGRDHSLDNSLSWQFDIEARIKSTICSVEIHIEAYAKE